MAGERGRSWWRRLSAQAWVLAIIGAAAFILVWWLVPPLLYAKAGDEAVRVKAITDTRTAFLAGLIGLGALGTFWLNSRVYRITARTFQVTERGHVTDRYSTAIGQLGSDSLDVRLGGIYALEQIAKDSARASEDQTTIVQVLSAFVRVHSDPIYQYKGSWTTGQVAWASSLSDEELAERAGDYVRKATKPPVDVQAAVTVLGGLPHLENVPRADLTGATLRHISLHADLTGAILSKADLTEANLSKATLIKADLIEADLSMAVLSEAKLEQAKIYGAKLDESNVLVHQLELALGDDKTQLPLGVPRPTIWERQGAC